MKREGYLMERIADPDNLRLAFWKARRGKEYKAEVSEYRMGLDANLAALRRELLSGMAAVGNYHYFMIRDPKERMICAAAFRERVLHHAVMNVCHPVFERFQTGDSYATRIGKGQYAALERAKGYTRRYRWFCKLDVRKFFDNIDHDVLYGKLCRMFKDPALLALFRRIIDSYEVSPGRGLPIGNLTSQYFANFYLGYADHHVRERLRVPAYVRYMDDMVLWHDDKAELLHVVREISSFIGGGLRMPLREPVINSTDKGVPFLGYVLFPCVVRLNRNSKKRFTRKYELYQSKLHTGEWSQADYALHVQPLVAFTRFADARAFRRAVAGRTEAGQKASTACFAAATGAATPRTAALRIATTAIPTTLTTTSGSASRLSHSSRSPVDSGHDEPACFPNPSGDEQYRRKPAPASSRRSKTGVRLIACKRGNNERKNGNVK